MSSESERLGQSAIDRIFFSDHLIDTDPFRSAIFLFLSFIELSRKGPAVQRSVTNKVKQRVVISIITKSTHSSEIKCLCLIKEPSKMFQYLPCGFLHSKNMANFEAFFWVISSTINLLFLKSILICVILTPH